MIKKYNNVNFKEQTHKHKHKKIYIHHQHQFKTRVSDIFE